MQLEFYTKNTELINDVEDFCKQWNDDQETISVHTSGSTGSPKKISLKKDHMKASAQMTGEYLGLKKGDTALLCLSSKTIAGKMMIVRSIIHDLRLIVTDVSSSPLKGLDKELSIDFAAMVPLQVENSLLSLNQIKKLIIGGGTIGSNLWNRICDKEVLAFQTFGMTETISHIAMRKITRSEDPYKALPNVNFHEEDRSLVITAPQLGVEGLKTNDAIELINNKTFKWLGRTDFVINSGGVKIHPEVIEQKLSTIINVPFFSFGIDDEYLGQKHVLIIESKDYIEIDKGLLNSALSAFEVPKELYLIDSFNRTISGKVNRLQTIKNLNNAKRQVL